jgi:hypothetical protein
MADERRRGGIAFVPRGCLPASCTVGRSRRVWGSSSRSPRLWAWPRRAPADAEALPFDFFLTNAGPTERAATGLEETRRVAFRADLSPLAGAVSRLPTGAPVAIPAIYFEALAVHPS